MLHLTDGVSSSSLRVWSVLQEAGTWHGVVLFCPHPATDSPRSRGHVSPACAVSSRLGFLSEFRILSILFHFGLFLQPAGEGRAPEQTLGGHPGCRFSVVGRMLRRGGGLCADTLSLWPPDSSLALCLPSLGILVQVRTRTHVWPSLCVVPQLPHVLVVDRHVAGRGLESAISDSFARFSGPSLQACRVRRGGLGSGPMGPQLFQ